MSVHHVKTHEEYEKLKDTDDLVVVDYSAEWCAPCRIFAPTFEKMAKKYKQCIFIHVDVDLFDEHLDCEDIKSVPTFKLFLNKKIKREFPGPDEKRLIKYIKRYGVKTDK